MDANIIVVMSDVLFSRRKLPAHGIGCLKQGLCFRIVQLLLKLPANAETRKDLSADFSINAGSQMPVGMKAVAASRVRSCVVGSSR